jgi:gamma-tubulin complex component 2
MKRQLRDGSTLAAPSRRQAGVPPPRAVSGRLPGGACIPPLLEAWKHKVLLAGKYLNVIRECGIDIGRDGSGRAGGGSFGSGAHEDEDDDLSMEDER